MKSLKNMLNDFLSLLQRENENLEKYFQLGVSEEKKILKFSNQNFNQKIEDLEKLFHSLNVFYLKRDEILREIFLIYRDFDRLKEENFLKPFERTQLEMKKYRKSFLVQRDKKKKLIQMILNQDERIFLPLKSVKSFLLKEIQDSFIKKKQMNSYKCDLSFQSHKKKMSII